MTEWAQLKAGPPNLTNLERGCWYIIETRRYDGLLRVLGPNAVVTPIHEDYVRIVTEEPNLITRVQATRGLPRQPGDESQMLEFYGVCPKGHKIERLGMAASQARCPACGGEFAVETEAHISEAS